MDMNNLLTLFFGILAIILYFRSPPKVIKCSISSQKLITNKQSKFSKLNILYDGEQVERITSTEIVFLNSSFSTIRKDDLIELAPFSVEIGNGEILDLSVIMGENTPNQISVNKLKRNSARISFHYLNHNEGGVIQIVHTGDEKSVYVSKKNHGW